MGNSTVSWDISQQVAEVVAKVLVSSSRENNGIKSHEKAEYVSAISHFDSEKRTALFNEAHLLETLIIFFFVQATSITSRLSFVEATVKSGSLPKGFKLTIFMNTFSIPRAQPTLCFVGIPGAGPKLLISQAQTSII